VPEERCLVERLREDVGTKVRARKPDWLGHAVSALLTSDEEELLVVASARHRARPQDERHGGRAIRVDRRGQAHRVPEELDQQLSEAQSMRGLRVAVELSLLRRKREIILIRLAQTDTEAPPKKMEKPKKSRGWRPHKASQYASSCGCEAE